MADLIVLAGVAAVEAAAKAAGHAVSVSFTPGRTDATQAQTDIASFDVMKPQADGFRNYAHASCSAVTEHLLIDRAQLLTLSAPEMTVLFGGMRVLAGNFENSKNGVLTTRPGQLSNDFFVNLIDIHSEWRPSIQIADAYECIDRQHGQIKWLASRVDLVFGSNSQLRALTEVYAQNDAGEKFVADFCAVWSKVMHLGFLK